MSRVTACHWSPTGYAYERPCGACSCRPAAPPGIVLYGGELLALTHQLERSIAAALEDDVRLAELTEDTPADYETHLASALSKLAFEVSQ